MELSEKLKAYLAQPNPDLFEASLLVAQHAQPTLEAAQYTRLIDIWADDLNQRLRDIDDNKIKLRRVNEFLFKELGFSGNHQDYYDPRNNMINHVIERRKGVPITMAVLYITLARRVGLDVVGASFPGHFLVKMTMEEGLIVLDPFNKGVSLGEEDLRTLLEYNNLTPNTELLSASLKTASMEETILRMLRNLKAVYLKEKNRESGLSMLNIMLSLNPELQEERRERGLLLHDLGCNHTALVDLKAYMASSKKAEKIEEIRPVVVDLLRNTPPLH